MEAVQTTGGVIRSTGVGAIAGALAKAQGEMLVPEKRRTATVRMRDEKGGGTYTYKYADLSDIRQAVAPALSKNGLALTQVIDASTMRLTTLLIHESGEFLGSTYDLPRGLAAQQFGSALTYAKRYSYCSILGVVAEEDDDAQIAQPATQRQVKVGKLPASIKPKASQVENGTSGLKLATVPAGLAREEIMGKISQLYPALMKLEPQLDFAAELMSRYGATSRKDLSDEEAYDFGLWMEERLQKGVSA